MNNLIKTTTTVKLDFIDRIKVLFGRTIVIKVNVFPLDDDAEFPLHSAVSSMEFETKTKQDFDYSPKFGFKGKLKKTVK